MADFLPHDWRQATLVGRMDLGEGPTPVVIRGGQVLDVSRAAPTVSALLNDWSGGAQGREVGDVGELGLARAWDGDARRDARLAVTVCVNHESQQHKPERT